MHVVPEVIVRYKVNCLVRAPQNMIVKNSQLTIFQGTPDNKEHLESAMKGCDAIISVLNISRHSDFPWSKLRTPPTFLSDVMRNLITLALQHEIKRVVLCSAWGVAETKKDLPSWFNWFIDNSNIGYAYRDHERQEMLLQNSGLNWTIVRPTGLTNFKKAQNVIESFDNKPKPRLTISRHTVAKYLVNALENDSLINQSVVISGR